MTANDLIAAFETLADAPDGVKRLRELVLRLAVRGKLVAQLPTDIPPAARASDTAALKRDNLWKLSSIDALPSTWRIVPFANLGQWGSGGTPLKGHPEYYDGDIPWLKIGDLNDGLVTTAETTISMEGLANSAAKMVPPGVLLVAMYGSIGKSGITGIRCCTNQAIAHCIPDLALVTLQYVFRLVGAMRHDLEMQGKGAAQQNISQTVLRHLLVPLPPLAEQHRIVTRVDELMGLLDRLEAARTARDDVRRAARDAALAALRDAEDTDAVEAAWGRIAGQMDALFAEPEDVGPLRQAVLGLAVRGRLVPQERPDESPCDRISRPAHCHPASAEGRRVQGGSAVLPEHVPFPVPEGWAWVRLATLVSDMKNGLYKPESFRSSDGVAYLRMYNIQDGSVDWTKIQRLDADSRESEQYSLAAGDLVLSRVNSAELVGKAALVRELTEPVIFEAMTIRVRLRDPTMSPFINEYLRTQGVRAYFMSVAKHAIGQSSINQSQVGDLPVPLPPIGEQRHIVAQVDTLMAQLNALQARLTSARDLHGQFAAAAVHHLDV